MQVVLVVMIPVVHAPRFAVDAMEIVQDARGPQEDVLHYAQETVLIIARVDV